jgi:hypothetical protein
MENNIYKQITEIELDNGYKIGYRKPGFAQLPYLIQWIVEGFAPSFLPRQKLDTMTTDEQFEESIKYLTGAYQNFTEEEQARLWGSAAYASKASIDYLFPVISQCFPEVNIYDLKDEVLDLCLSKMITDYFNSIAEAGKQKN